MQRDERVENLFLNTQSLIRGWKSYFYKVLKPEGLSPTQMSVLFHIGSNQPVNGQNIRVAFQMSPSAVSQLIDSLDGHGFITKETRAEDRRATYYSLSDAGARKHTDLEVKRKEFFKSITASLSDDEIETMIALQTKLISETGPQIVATQEMKAKEAKQ